MAESIRIDTTQLTALIRRVEQQGTSFATVVLPVVNRALAEAEGDIKDLLGGPVLKVRSGQARASVHVIPAQADAKGVIGSVGTNSPYLEFLYKGGTIVPRKAKALAIPVGDALTPAGIPRFHSPRQIPNLIFIPKTKRGNMILALRTAGGGLNPMFVLKKSVTIGPHDFLTKPTALLTLKLKQDISAALTRVIHKGAA